MSLLSFSVEIKGIYSGSSFIPVCGDDIFLTFFSGRLMTFPLVSGFLHRYKRALTDLTCGLRWFLTASARLPCVWKQQHGSALRSLVFMW